MATTKIKDPVEGIIDLDRLPGVDAFAARRLIDAPELQRLRRIKQLGFSEMVYPGATHSRFAHSLGTFQGAQRTMRQLRASGMEIPDEWFVATALACLFHDLGHGPFSHTFEAVMGQKHESRTVEILQNGPSLPGLLDGLAPGTSQRILELLQGQVSESGLAGLADLVSSALDCDRMDYLRRDSIHTGTLYGNFDRDWLVRGLVPSVDGSAMVLMEKGKSAVEQYLIGRYHMFQNVYLHKTSRGFETAFRGLCQRLRDLGPDSTPSACRVFALLHEDALSLTAFLGLTDDHFHVELDLLVAHEDATVRALARALHLRQPLRCLGHFENSAAMDDALEQRREQAAADGLDPECAVWRDQASDVPYRPYSPSQGRRGLRIQQSSGRLVDVTELSPTLQALARPVVVHRLYWVERAD